MSWTLAAFALLALLGAVGAATGWDLLRDSRTASIGEILTGVPGTLPVEVRTKSSEPKEVKVPGVEDTTEPEAQERLTDAGLETEVRLRNSPPGDAGRVLAQSLPSGSVADKGSKVLLTVGEAPEAAKVPDVVGLSYPEAENSLEASGYLLGGVREAHSDTVPAGMIIKQNPLSGSAPDTSTYVYLTTSVGPPQESNAAPRTESQPEGYLTPIGTGAPSIRGGNGRPSLLAHGNRAAISYVFDSLLRRSHPKEGFTSPADAQYSR